MKHRLLHLWPWIPLLVAFALVAVPFVIVHATSALMIALVVVAAMELLGSAVHEIARRAPRRRPRPVPTPEAFPLDS